MDTINLWSICQIEETIINLKKNMSQYKNFQVDSEVEMEFYLFYKSRSVEMHGHFILKHIDLDQAVY